jgi:hypothetical protein
MDHSGRDHACRFEDVEHEVLSEITTFSPDDEFYRVLESIKWYMYSNQHDDFVVPI